MRLSFLFIIILCILIVGCGITINQSDIYIFNPSLESDNISISGNPLDYASEQIALDIQNVNLLEKQNFSLPLSCRFPIIDAISERPLFMKQWAEENADLLSKTQKESGLDAITKALEILKGTDVYPETNGLESEATFETFEKELLKTIYTNKYKQIITKLFKEYLISYDLVTHPARFIDDGLLSIEKQQDCFLSPGGDKIFINSLYTDVNSTFIEQARKVDIPKIFKAAMILSNAIQEYIEATQDFTMMDFIVDESQKNLTFQPKINISFTICGFSNDMHEQDMSFLIDLGGDDIYSNNAGGTIIDNSRGVSLPATCIDHSGNDRYLAKNKKFVQGYGFIAPGFLVDLKGNDIYKANQFSQGVGNIGVGVLYDKQGDDKYSCNAFCQGAAMFGLGMILDDLGNDSYNCATMGQGCATTLGLGISLDLEGDDTYALSVDMTDSMGYEPGYGQGAAFSFWEYSMTTIKPYGGIGILIDAKGCDNYKSNGEFVQGSSSKMSLGCLVDFEGDDSYLCISGQGYACHLSNAILIDKSGNDSYFGKYYSGGSAEKSGIGIFIDYQGDDTYGSSSLSFGVGLGSDSFALFIDYKGEDTYTLSDVTHITYQYTSDGFGSVIPGSDPNNWPYAVFLDLSGQDDYIAIKRKNNSQNLSFGHGIFIDTESRNEDVIGSISYPLQSYEDIPPIDIPKNDYPALTHLEVIKQLQNPDTFERFHSSSNSIIKDGLTYKYLCPILKTSNHQTYNKDLLELFHSLFRYDNDLFDDFNFGQPINKLIDNIKSTLPYVLDLISAEDDMVRSAIIKDFGIFKFKLSTERLTESLKTEKVAQVRYDILNSLIRIQKYNFEDKPPKRIEYIKTLIEKDSSPKVRAAAIKLMSYTKEDSDLSFLIDVLKNDKDSSVKIATCEVLSKIGDFKIVKNLLDATRDKNIYVQRAAGKALAELGEIDGVQILINSLAFPSSDVYEYGGYDWPSIIAAFVGHDFDYTKRFKKETWQKWFDDNKNKIDFKSNVSAYNDFESYKDSIYRPYFSFGAASRFNSFLEIHPNNYMAKKQFSWFLNSEAWEMVTSTQSYKFDTKQGLIEAKQAVELNPDPMIIDTLAEAFLANSMYDESEKVCKDALKDYPNDWMFMKRLDRIRLLRIKKQ